EALPDFAALGEEFEWQKVASTLFGLWCDASMRDIQPIPEDGGRFKERSRDEPRRDKDREPRGDRDRRDRNRRDRDRDSKVPSQTSPPPPGKRRVFIGLGKVEKIRPGELIGMLYNESGIPDGAIGQLHLFPRHSLVDVDEEYAEKLVHGGKNARFRGRAIRIRFDDRS
ncbi:MAG: DbpA RNA binding domain-containing protein, partial [Verrucomicrobiota bacterium]